MANYRRSDDTVTEVDLSVSFMVVFKDELLKRFQLSWFHFILTSSSFSMFERQKAISMISHK